MEQVNHYYPYGGLMAESTGWNIQRYKYNGKELDRMHGLDWLFNSFIRPWTKEEQEKAVYLKNNKNQLDILLNQIRQ